ncbi:MAG: hypothetical protein KAW40_04530 [Candidatus Aenigmarchaeota archaeon]|nr:hypothetical protein [Candidatus Aenigmarchaeota archaeon]
MTRKNYYKNTVKNVIRILNLLKKSGQDGELVTISKISKLTGLHKWTVSRTIDLYMSPYVEIMIPEGFEDVGLKIKFVKLKDPDIKKEQVLRFLKLRSLTF